VFVFDILSRLPAYVDLSLIGSLYFREYELLLDVHAYFCVVLNCSRREYQQHLSAWSVPHPPPGQLSEQTTGGERMWGRHREYEL
jgi:hypothetical protein